MPIPLATLLRPQKLQDIVGQEHLLGENMPLTKMAKLNEFASIIFWGPPGCGKTTLVRALAKETNANFRPLNATSATIKEVRVIIESAKKSQLNTFMFIDEIQRFSCSQQDTLLPAIEEGIILLFGATTENPKFAVNSTILSRCLVFEIKPLSQTALIKLIIKIKEYYALSGKIVKIDREVVEVLVNRCSGDARKLITVAETCVEILSDDGIITLDHVNQAIPDKHLVFDASGNDHYNYAHCYQESIQHSDVDSAIYWLAVWLESGESPAYICRRMLITAFEDCASNPFAITTAMAACFTVERTGLPECVIPMALATCEMAKSERNKSAYYAIKEALTDVRNKETIHVPPELRAGTTGYISAITKKYLKGWKERL